MTKITLKLDAEGGVQLLNAEGFGPRCQEATSRLERRLGHVQEGSRVLTEDYYRQETGATVSSGTA